MPRAYLKAVHEQSDKIHEIREFRRFRVPQEVHHQRGDQIRNAASGRSDDPRKSKPCLEQAGFIRQGGGSRIDKAYRISYAIDNIELFQAH